MDQGNLGNDRIGAGFMALVGNIITKKAKCILVSKGITPKIAEELGFMTTETPEQALGKAYELLGKMRKSWSSDTGRDHANR